MSDRISDLERLTRLRQEGAISNEEFAAEKARLLGTRAPGGAPMRPKLWWMLPALGIVLVVLVIVGAVMLGRSAIGGGQSVHPAPTPRPRPTPTATSDIASLAPDERLAAAVRAAFPNGPTANGDDGQHYVFDTSRLVDAPFGPVLVSEGRVPDFSHADGGRLDITYLAPAGERYVATRRFPAAAEAGSMGQMTEWSVSNRFSDLPVIYAEGGFSGQGYTCGTTSLVELRPEGVATVATFQDSYSNDGAADGDADRIEGKIRDIVPNRSFTVHFTGTRTFDRRYVRVGDRYRLVGGADDRLPQC